MLTCRWNSFTGNYNLKIQLEDNKIVRETGKDLNTGIYNYRITNLFMEQVRR